jgi:hypothetical protein
VTILTYVFYVYYAAGCALMATNFWGFSARVHGAFRRTWMQMNSTTFNRVARLTVLAGTVPFILWRLFFGSALVAGILGMASSG